jgi:hypothetical protein
MLNMRKSDFLLPWMTAVLVLCGCQTCPPPCPKIPKQQLSPSAVRYLEKAAQEQFEGQSPEKLVEMLRKEGREAIDRREPLALREVHDRVKTTIHALGRPDGEPLDGFADSMESLVTLRNDLHDALWKEVVARVLAVHQVCFGATTVKENLSEWQAGSFYLGLLPEPRTADEAKKYQEVYTAHEQVKEKITSQAQIRYSKWAVGQMKALAKAFRHAKEGLNDNEQAMISAGIEYLGPIVTSSLTVEASQLYNSLVQDMFAELNVEQRAKLIEGIENARKDQPYGDPYAPALGDGASTGQGP